MDGVNFMLCENCGKNPANVVFTKIVDGNKTVRHLCQDCMQQEEKSFTMQFPGMMQTFGNLYADAQEARAPEVQCEKCGMTWSRFQKGGEVGCADCYNAFRAQLSPVLKRVHGNAKHAGKLPRSASEDAKKRSRMDCLRSQLNEAVTNEEYEKAAGLRDEIRQMENGGEALAGEK